MVSTASNESNDIFRNRVSLWWLHLAVVLIVILVVVIALKADSIVITFFISNLVSSTFIPAWPIGLSDRCYAWRGFEVIVGGLGEFIAVLPYGLVVYDCDVHNAGGLLLLQEGLYGNNWVVFVTFVAAPVRGLLFALAAFLGRLLTLWIIAKKCDERFTALDKPVTRTNSVTMEQIPTSEQGPGVYTDTEHSVVVVKGKLF